MTYSQPRPAPRQAAPRARQAPRRKPRWGFILIALAIIGALAWFLVSVYGGSSGSFKARVTSTNVVNPATLAVAIQVTNTSGSAATPDCTVDATDPSGAYTGANEGTFSSAIAPGQTDTSVMDVTITGLGARYVTSATVTCSG